VDDLDLIEKVFIQLQNLLDACAFRPKLRKVDVSVDYISYELHFSTSRMSSKEGSPNMFSTNL
jgi:hypothetical protein